MLSATSNANFITVLGPAPIRLGFIGAPIASAISFSLVSLISLLYGVLFVPRTAWHPISSRMFSNLGVLVRLGLSGVGKLTWTRFPSTYWLGFLDLWRTNGIRVVGLGTCRTCSFSVRNAYSRLNQLPIIRYHSFGPVALASQSVLLVSTTTTFQVPYSLAVATSIRSVNLRDTYHPPTDRSLSIGNLLGEKRARRAGVAAYASIFAALILSSVTRSELSFCSVDTLVFTLWHFSLIYFLFRNSWAYMFNDDPGRAFPNFSRRWRFTLLQRL